MEFQWGLHAFLKSQESSKNKTMNTVRIERPGQTDKLDA